MGRVVAGDVGGVTVAGDWESVLAEPGAMVSHSDGVAVDTTGRDGLLSCARSMLGGESMFANEFTATDGPGAVTLAPATPGDVDHHKLEAETLYAVDGAFLAADTAVDIDVEFGGLKSRLAGANLVPLALRGPGDVFRNVFGGPERVDLADGEIDTVDNDHVLAREESVAIDARRVGGLEAPLLDGQGLVMEFTGPGTAWYQIRGPDAVASALAALLPGRSQGSDEGFDADDFVRAVEGRRQFPPVGCVDQAS